jgi:hypothetical protein
LGETEVEVGFAEKKLFLAEEGVEAISRKRSTKQGGRRAEASQINFSKEQHLLVRLVWPKAGTTGDKGEMMKTNIHLWRMIHHLESPDPEGIMRARLAKKPLRFLA